MSKETLILMAAVFLSRAMGPWTCTAFGVFLVVLIKNPELIEMLGLFK